MDKAYKDRPVSHTGLEHDRPYMKLDVWNAGGIEAKFGHDPATYPDQDTLQHYPTSQFNPGMVMTSDNIDSNLNLHFKKHQKAVQVSRPGFVNAPSGLHSYESVLPVAEENSNEAGKAFAKDKGLTTVTKVVDIPAKPEDAAASVRPGFQNKPVTPISTESTLPISKENSNEVGNAFAKENNIKVKEGTQESQPPRNPEPPKVPESPQAPKEPQAGCGEFDGSICSAEGVTSAAEKAVEDLLKPATSE